MSKEIRFKASIPPVQSALKFGGKIGRVTLEIPESEISKAVGLIALQETPLEVVIRVDDSQGQETSRPEGEGVRGKELRKNFAF